MSKWTMSAALALLFGVGLAHEPAAQSGSKPSTPVKRVDRFTRPSGLRVKLPANASGTVPRQACPTTSEMCQKFWALAGHFLANNTIPARDRELLVLRTAYLSRVDYEWAHHHDSYSTKAGLTVQDVSRVTQGPDASGWGEFDRALLRAADELHANRFISDSTWKTLASRYDDHQLVEVVLTVGNYTMLGMYFNSLGVPIEAGLTRVPD
jgi:4-carboxymuconolactone decarboxylase